MKPHGENMGSHHKKQFLVMLVIHFLAMYFIMYTMIDSLADFYANTNQLYMTLMMVTAMAILMLWSMRSMYDRKMVRNWSFVSLILFIFSFYAMRDQTLVGDRQFLRSMIPHHSGAILMCGKSKITDVEILKLCESIMSSQKSEIEQMKKILERL